MTAFSEQEWQLPEPPDTAPKTAQEYAYKRLRYAIMVGGIPPGAALTIRGVADALSLSLTPVRESLKRLCAEGALYLQSNRRIITPPMTARRHAELVDTRIALEQFALARALAFITDNDIDHLMQIDQEMDLAIEQRNYIALVILNQRFHSYLYSRNPEQVCLPMIESIWLQLGPFSRLAAEQVEEFLLEDWHKHLLAALRRRDADAAIAAIESDILDGTSLSGIRRARPDLLAQ